MADPKPEVQTQVQTQTKLRTQPYTLDLQGICTFDLLAEMARRGMPYDEGETDEGEYLATALFWFILGALCTMASAYLWKAVL